MILLLPTAKIQDMNSEESTVKLIFDQLTGLEKSMDKSLYFHQLERADQALMVWYLLSCLRKFGFKGFFDPSRPECSKANLAAYANKNREQIETLSGKMDGKELDEEGILKWINNRLRFLHITVTRTNFNNKRKFKCYLDSPWRLISRDNKVVVVCHKIETGFTEKDYLSSNEEISKKLNLV
jgi:hypothetical protein